MAARTRSSMPSYRPQSSARCDIALIRDASSCVNLRPCGDSRITASGSPRRALIASTARASGSGFITIPGPPPYGTSSTLR
jgi:hypothetical protein